jgi:hypothetical protein
MSNVTEAQEAQETKETQDLVLVSVLVLVMVLFLLLVSSFLGFSRFDPSTSSNNHKILSKVNRAQETTFNKISALFESNVAQRHHQRLSN